MDAVKDPSWAVERVRDWALRNRRVLFPIGCFDLSELPFKRNEEQRTIDHLCAARCHLGTVNASVDRCVRLAFYAKTDAPALRRFRVQLAKFNACIAAEPLLVNFVDVRFRDEATGQAVPPEALAAAGRPDWRRQADADLRSAGVTARLRRRLLTLISQLGDTLAARPAPSGWTHRTYR